MLALYFGLDSFSFMVSLETDAIGVQQCTYTAEARLLGLEGRIQGNSTKETLAVKNTTNHQLRVSSKGSLWICLRSRFPAFDHYLDVLRD